MTPRKNGLMGWNARRVCNDVSRFKAMVWRMLRTWNDIRCGGMPGSGGFQWLRPVKKGSRFRANTTKNHRRVVKPKTEFRPLLKMINFHLVVKIEQRRSPIAWLPIEMFDSFVNILVNIWVLLNILKISNKIDSLESNEENDTSNFTKMWFSEAEAHCWVINEFSIRFAPW